MLQILFFNVAYAHLKCCGERPMDLAPSEVRAPMLPTKGYMSRYIRDNILSLQPNTRAVCACRVLEPYVSYLISHRTCEPSLNLEQHVAIPSGDEGSLLVNFETVHHLVFLVGVSLTPGLPLLPRATSSLLKKNCNLSSNHINLLYQIN